MLDLKISNLFLLIFLLNLCSQFNELVVKFVIEKQNSKKEDQNEKKMEKSYSQSKICKKRSFKFEILFCLFFNLQVRRGERILLMIKMDDIGINNLYLF
jgi:hypothetical protein